MEKKILLINQKVFRSGKLFCFVFKIGQISVTVLQCPVSLCSPFDIKVGMKRFFCFIKFQQRNLVSFYYLNILPEAEKTTDSSTIKYILYWISSSSDLQLQSTNTSKGSCRYIWLHDTRNRPVHMNTIWREEATRIQRLLSEQRKNYKTKINYSHTPFTSLLVSG